MTTNRPAAALQELIDDACHTVAWEETACPLCGAAPGGPFLEAPDSAPPVGTGLLFAVVKCPHCGLCYTNPRPDPDTISQFYPPDYGPHRTPARARAARAPRSFWGRVTGRPCRERRGHLPWRGTGRLLDFGCGGGGFLRTMAQRGWTVTGLDASASTAEHVREQFGLNVLVGTLPHPDLLPGSFDVVTMWHSLEHVHQPLETLCAAYRLLVPGGKLIVATPNIDSTPFRLFGQNWSGLELPRHLTHFAPETLAAVLHAAGFRTESVRHLRHDEWLRSSARLAERGNAAGVLTRLLMWKPLARLTGWMCYARGTSDCIMCVAERPA